MILIFEAKDNSFYMATNNMSKNHDTDEYISIEVPDFNPAYEYTLVDGKVVKGDLWTLTSEEIAELEAEAIATAHETPRMLAYPSIREQLDKLYHDIDDGKLDKTGEFYKTLKAVKDANPKS